MKQTTDQAIEAIKQIAEDQTNEGLITPEQVNTINEACETIGAKITELELEVDDLKDENEQNEKIIDSLRDDLDDETKNKLGLSQRIDELEMELEESVKDFTLPTLTLEDANKNKVLLNIHNNLTLEQIEILEGKAKEMMAKGIIYKEVV